MATGKTCERCGRPLVQTVNHDTGEPVNWLHEPDECIRNLRAENERLRAALTEIATNVGKTNQRFISTWHRDVIVNVAKYALSGRTGDA